MVHFRKRFGLDEVGEINEMIIKATAGGTVTNTDDDDDWTSGAAAEGGEPPEQSYSTIESQQDQQSTTERPNKGKQILDASCAPADIRYPTDLSILNEAREKTEEIIDAFHRPDVGKTIKPRTYRRKARKDYLAVAKKKIPRRKAVRRAIGKQLRYLRRNLGHIRVLGTPERLQLLTWYEYRCLLVVRPIVRGKVARPVEFGAKFSMSRVDGIYRTRENVRYCRERDIRISGPPLGRPKRDATERERDCKQTQLDEITRIAIEESFGVGKRRYTLDRILERRPDTSESMIAVILLVMNLETLLRRFFVSIFNTLCGAFGRIRLTVRTLEAACQTFYRSYGWTV